MDYAEVGGKLENLLGLQRHAVSISFLDAVPPGIYHVKSPGPASCAYWKQASEGEVFYTTTEDHFNCTIGAYTHGAPLPSEKAAELKSTIGQMIGLGYLRTEEVGSIPHRTQPLHVAVYAPLAQSPFAPNVVLVRGNRSARGHNREAHLCVHPSRHRIRAYHRKPGMYRKPRLYQSGGR